MAMLARIARWSWRFGLWGTVLFAPVLAWLWPVAPAWRRSFPAEFLFELSGDGRRVLVKPLETGGTDYKVEILDAATGAVASEVNLTREVQPPRILPDGRRLLAVAPATRELLVVDSEGKEPSKRRPWPKIAEEVLFWFSSKDGRWAFLLCRWHDGADPQIGTALYDLTSDAPPKMFKGLRASSLLVDGERALLHEVEASDPLNATYRKSALRVCIQLKTGARLWESSLLDDYRFTVAVPANHWLVFYRTGRNSPADDPARWVVLDDRDGKQVAQWSPRVMAVSKEGVIAETDEAKRHVVVKGAGVDWEFDAGPPSPQRTLDFVRCERSRDRLRVEDISSIFRPDAWGLKQWIAWSSAIRWSRREWDLEARQEFHADVHYVLNYGGISWDGIDAPEGRFIVQKRGFLGQRYLQRIDVPERANTPLRAILGAAPAVAMFVWMRRRVGRSSMQFTSSKQLLDSPASEQ
jgi:hypothetical protein